MKYSQKQQQYKNQSSYRIEIIEILFSWCSKVFKRNRKCKFFILKFSWTLSKTTSKFSLKRTPMSPLPNLSHFLRKALWQTRIPYIYWSTKIWWNVFQLNIFLSLSLWATKRSKLIWNYLKKVMKSWQLGEIKYMESMSTTTKA